jgi:4'-phosphopantetheinyl transferase
MDDRRVIDLPSPVADGATIHIHRRRFSELTGREAEFSALLSQEELTRAHQYIFDTDRIKSVISRGLTRKLIASYLNIPPDLLRFAYGPFGKPALPHEMNPEDLVFNVSHSGDQYLLAVSRRNEIGVDIEKIRPVPQMRDIIHRDAAHSERVEFSRLTEEEKTAGFFRWWTRKEALIKATGDGASAALPEFETGVTTRNDPTRVRLLTGCVWIRSLPIESGYVAALAVLDG